jgi:hypothetical protein
MHISGHYAERTTFVFLPCLLGLKPLDGIHENLVFLLSQLKHQLVRLHLGQRNLLVGLGAAELGSDAAPPLGADRRRRSTSEQRPAAAGQVLSKGARRLGAAESTAAGTGVAAKMHRHALCQPAHGPERHHSADASYTVSRVSETVRSRPTLVFGGRELLTETNRGVTKTLDGIDSDRF